MITPSFTYYQKATAHKSVICEVVKFEPELNSSTSGTVKFNLNDFRGPN